MINIHGVVDMKNCNGVTAKVHTAGLVKHAEALQAWLDGKTIEMQYGDNTWGVNRAPNFAKGVEYRVQPAEPQVECVPVGSVFMWDDKAYLRVHPECSMGKAHVHCVRLTPYGDKSDTMHMTHFVPDGETPVKIVGTLEEYFKGK